jgi:hypothetical protein
VSAQNFGVRELAALHGRADSRKRRQRLGDAHLLASRAEVNARTPVQPMRAREETVVPAGTRVELPQQHEQLVSGGMEAGGQGGDRLAEVFGFCSTGEHEGGWRHAVGG